MRILVDEDLPKAVAALLRERGHEPEHVLEAGLRGSPDETILRHATDRKAALMTADLDFSNIKQYPLGSHNGVIVLRFPDYFRRRDILSLVSRFLDSADLDSLAGALVVVSPGSYRVRRLSSTP